MRKRNPLALLWALILTCLAALATAGEITLPVSNNIRDDGSHAFMPLLSPLSDHFPEPRKMVQDPQPEPQLWSAAYLFRLCGDKDDRASAGALRRIGELTRGGKLRVNVDGYAGASLRKTVPVAAVLLGMQYQAFDQAWVSGHVGAVTTSGQPSGLCVGVSVNVRFGAPSQATTTKMTISELSAMRRE